MYGLCPLSIVPLRAEPSDRAEQVSQVIFGEPYQVLETQSKWLRIKLTLDQYEGWIDAKQHQPIPEAYYHDWLSAAPHPRTLDVVGVVADDHTRTPVQLGSILPFYDGLTLRLGPNPTDKRFYNGLATNRPPRNSGSKLTPSTTTC